MLKTISSITNALGALNYKGTWNALTNSPTLADGTGAKGDYYVTSTAGTQTFGGLLLFFGVGDWIVYNGAVWQRVEGGSDGNFANITLNSTDAGASAAPLLDLYRDSATPAASDTLGEIEFNGEDSAGNKQQYAVIHASILSPTSGSEQGQIHFETATGGASTEKMIIGTSNLVINEIGAVFNVRIEGDADANLLFTDATNDRVGVGTISPATKLDVNGVVSGASFIPSSSSTPTNGMYLPAANTLGFSTNSTNRVTIDSSGNLGLTATPSAWSAGYNIMQFSNATGAFIGGSGYSAQLGANAYLNSSSQWTAGGSTYKASRYEQFDGGHFWYTAPTSGGNPITFTQPMALDNNGLLLVKNANNTGAIWGECTSASFTDAILRARAARNTTNGTFTAIEYYNTGAAAFKFYVLDSGAIYSTSIVITAISDERLKENIRDIDTGLSTIMALKPRRFDWKEGQGQDKKNVAGFIAQEFENVFPECVSTSKAGGDGIEYKNINHETLIPTLVKAIQDQQALIESLTSRLTALENK